MRIARRVFSAKSAERTKRRLKRLPARRLVRKRAKRPSAEERRLAPRRERKRKSGERRSAKRKTYEYVMYTAGVESPLRRTRELYIGRSADAELMDSAARLLVGTHDFSAFMSSGSSAKTFTRTIYSAEVRTAGDRIVFRITGSGFLYNMVRIIVGALVRIGRGEKELSSVQTALETGDRRLMPDIAPPQALYLVGAEYV